MNLGSVHGSVHGFVHGLVYSLVHGTWGFYMDHVIPLRPFKTVLDHVLLEHGGLHCVLPCAVHLDLGHLGVVGWPKILVSAPVPLELIWLGLTGLGLGLGGLGFGTGLDNWIPWKLEVLESSEGSTLTLNLTPQGRDTKKLDMMWIFVFYLLGFCLLSHCY